MMVARDEGATRIFINYPWNACNIVVGTSVKNLSELIKIYHFETVLGSLNAIIIESSPSRSLSAQYLD